MPPIVTPRSHYIITDDGPQTRAYRVPTREGELDGHDRRPRDGHDRRPRDGHDRRERIRRTLDWMQATPDEVSRIAAADRRDHDRDMLDRTRVTPDEVSRIAAADRRDHDRRTALLAGC